MNVNLNLYKYFYEVAKYQSYTKASEIMLISQPSLSYSVKTLESQLNTKLFNKKNNKITLTEEGEILYKKLETVFEILDSIKTIDINKKIKIGVRNAYANRILPSIISKLEQVYPNLLVEIFVANSKTLLNTLSNKEIDLVIDEIPYGNEFGTLLIDKMFNPIFFSGKEKYNELKDKVLDYDTLLKEDIVIVYRNQLYKNLEVMYKDFNFVKKQSTSILVNEVRFNEKIGMMQKEFIQDELDNKVLFELKTNIELPESYAYINYNKDNKNKALSDFIKFINEYINNN